MHGSFKRWTLSVLLAATFFLTSIGCKKETGGNSRSDTSAGGSAGAKPKPLICVSLLTLTNPFFKDIADTLKSEGEKRGYEVVVTDGEKRPATQQDQVHDFLVRKASAIVLTPCDSKTVGTAISAANAARVPVFTADIACTADGAKVVSHCATDNFEGGRVAGQAIVQALGGHGKVAVLNQRAVESGLMRENGCLEELAKAPGITVVAKLDADGDRDRASSVMADILQGHPDIDAVFCINDPTALGAMVAIQSANKIAQVKIFGFDGQKEARQAVKDGKIYGTVMQHPTQIASTTIENIAKYLAGEDVPPKVLLKPTIFLAADAKTDPELK